MGGGVGGLPLFYYFTDQLHLLSVSVGGSKVSLTTPWVAPPPPKKKKIESLGEGVRNFLLKRGINLKSFLY